MSANHDEVLRKKLITVERSEAPRGILGFTLLRSIALARKELGMQQAVYHPNGRYEVMIRDRGVKMYLFDENGCHFDSELQYAHITIVAVSGGKATLRDADDVIASFTNALQGRITAAHDEPAPTLAARYCRSVHAGTRDTIVTWVEDCELWECPVEGLILEEDTIMRPVNPFLL